MRSVLVLCCSVFATSSAFFGGGGGCGCGMQLPQLSLPPPPPLCLPQIQLPKFCLPQIPMCPPPNPCGCGRRKRDTQTAALLSDRAQCNSLPLKNVIKQNLSLSSPTASQAAIHSAAKAKLGGEWAVFCVTGASEQTTTFTSDQTTFCAAGNEKQTCYAFQI